MDSGKYSAAMRGANDRSASPWVAKPIIVTRAMARRSPRTKMAFFMVSKDSTAPDVDSSIILSKLFVAEGGE